MPVDLYIFQFGGNDLILRAPNPRQAECRAYHTVVSEMDVEPERLETLDWPTDEDYTVTTLDEPIILGEG